MPFVGIALDFIIKLLGFWASIAKPKEVKIVDTTTSPALRPIKSDVYNDLGIQLSSSKGNTQLRNSEAGQPNTDSGSKGWQREARLRFRENS